jgi:DNA/RNA-binding domain of Phe-tRNA-synthetase-like protein
MTMIDVIIDPIVKDRLPRFRLGVFEYIGAVISPKSPHTIKEEIDSYTNSIREKELLDISGVKEWRTAFKQLGMDPSRYRPSSEALLRRVIQQKPMYWVNSAVDVNNFLSIKYALPFGIYNASRIAGSTVTCRLGHPGESYEGLNNRESSMEGKLVVSDNSSAFGSPIVDSLRTSVEEKTTHLLQIAYIHPDFPEDLLDFVADLFVRVHGGDVAVKKVVS